MDYGVTRKERNRNENILNPTSGFNRWENQGLPHLRLSPYVPKKKTKTASV